MATCCVPKLQDISILALLLLCVCSPAPVSATELNPRGCCRPGVETTPNANTNGPASTASRPRTRGNAHHPTVSCAGHSCTVRNAYRQWPGRGQCRAAMAAFPTTEQEVIDAVAWAASRGQPMKVVTATGHSRPRWACPRGTAGLVISTQELSRRIDVDQNALRVTVDSGVHLRTLIDTLARAGLALTHSPYLDAVTVGGLISTGSHGSSLAGKGPAVHEYVVAMRLVVPAPAEEGYAKVVQLDAGEELLLNAARVSLGLLGVITQVTLAVELQFKRAMEKESISSDDELEERLLEVGRKFEFGDVAWLPSMHKVVVSKEWRLPCQTPGLDSNGKVGFEPLHYLVRSGLRRLEEFSERRILYKCAMASLLSTSFLKHGLSLPFLKRTRWPKIGYNHVFQASGSCARSKDPNWGCIWDRTGSKDLTFSEASFTIPLENATNFIQDVKKLRKNVSPPSLCVLDFFSGLLIRFATPSAAFLGHQFYGITVEMLLHKSDDPYKPRLHQDIFEEIEQLAFFKYGALPHWGKNRPLAFMNLRSKYSNMHRFLAAKSMLDPKGLFSSEWSDSALEIKGNVTSNDDFCALEGLCVCREDRHCAPEAGYFCQHGKVYKEARVCAKRGTDPPALKLFSTGLIFLMQSCISFAVTTVYDTYMFLQDLFKTDTGKI